jgi:hypothetical protein
MSKILRSAYFASDEVMVEKRAEAVESWMDGVREMNESSGTGAIYCFVSDREYKKVTVLYFSSKEDMDQEMGELEPEMGEEVQLYLPVIHVD